MGLESKPKSPIFLLHSPLLAGRYRERLFGACVADPYQPAKAFAPANGPKAIDIIPGNEEGSVGIDPDPVIIDNFYSVVNSSSNTEVRSRFEQLVKAFFNKDQSSQEAKQAATAEWRSMERPLDFFHELIKNKAYQQEIMNEFNKRPGEPLYFVTNMLVLSAAKMDKGAVGGAIAGASATVPAPHTNGTTIMAEVGGEHSSRSGRQTGGQYRHEMIVALGVYEITLQKPKTRILSYFRKRKNTTTMLKAMHIDGNTKVLRDLKMADSLTEPPDRAEFMSQKVGKVQGEKGEERLRKESENSLPFETYYPCKR